MAIPYGAMMADQAAREAATMERIKRRMADQLAMEEARKAAAGGIPGNDVRMIDQNNKAQMQDELARQAKYAAMGNVGGPTPMPATPAAAALNSAYNAARTGTGAEPNPSTTPAEPIPGPFAQTLSPEDPSLQGRAVEPQGNQGVGADPAAAYLAANPDVAASAYYGKNPYEHYQTFGQKEGRTWTGATPGVDTAATNQITEDQLRQMSGAMQNKQSGWQNAAGIAASPATALLRKGTGK